MPAKRLKNNRGVALLVTLTVTTVLIASALAWNQKIRSAVKITAYHRDRLTLSYMAASSVSIGMAMLVEDKMQSSFDSLQEDWANPEKIKSLLEQVPFEEGSVNYTISDEIGKIQINALVQFPGGNNFNESQSALWDRFLSLFASEETFQEDSDPTAIINSLKDWLDSGDDDAITGLSGAESAYYQSLETPYPCKNGPVHHIGELALVKGITPELLQPSKERDGIKEYLTVNGIKYAEGNTFTYDGKININTAPLQVLKAMLPLESQDIAQAIYEYRRDTENLADLHDLSNPNWYQSVPGAGGLKIDPALITTSSDVFSIESTATLRNLKMSVTAVVQREQEPKTGRWHCRVLNWQAK